jgi:hypothetical protein
LAIAPHRLYVETVLAATPTRKRPRDEKVMQGFQMLLRDLLSIHFYETNSHPNVKKCMKSNLTTIELP